jgi:hypothetical protein
VKWKAYALGVAPIVVVVGLLLGPSGLGSAPATVTGSPAPGVLIPPAPGVATTLSLGGAVGVHSASPCWGLVAYDDYGSVSQQDLGRFLNSTPITEIRLGGGDDGYDPTTGIEYQAPPSGSGRFVAVHQIMVNFTWFEAWCDARTPHCLWMTYLPGEENNTQAAIHTAQYFHNVLHFVPTYWEFGNEPIAWTHWGINRSSWSTSDASPATGPAYAAMVHSYIAGISKMFPNDRYMGIQNSCACDPSLITDLAQTDGARIAGMAYHEYPWLNGSSSLASQFFGALESSRSVPNTSAHMEEMVAAGCATCD